MRHMQQNVSAPAKDIKTFIFTNSKACGVTNNAKARPKECLNIHKSSMFMNVL